MRTHSLKTLALLLCLVLQPLSPAFCGGSQETDLKEVQRLIDRLDYPAALRLLAKIQREHPEMRDETQQLIVRIISTQGQKYNEVLAELVHVLYDEGDEKKAVSLIEDLRRLDPNRSPAEAGKLTGYVKFLTLMTNAAGLLSQKKYPEAISLYLLPITDPSKAGFDMEKPDFDSASYGDIVKSSVREAVSRMVSNASETARDESSLRGAAASASALLASAVTADSISRLDDALAPLSGEMRRERAVRGAASALEAVNRTLAGSAAGGKGDPYVRYLIWLGTGRPSKAPEGIAEAIRRLWQVNASSVADAAVASSTAGLAEARRLVDARNFVAADPALAQAYYRGLMAVKASALAGSSVQPLPDWSFDAEDSELLRSVVARFSAAQENAGEARALRALISSEQELQALPAAQAVAPSALPDLRTRLRRLADSTQKLGAEWQERMDSLQLQADAGFAVQPVITSAGSMARRLDSLSARLQERDTAYALVLAANQAGTLEAQFKAAAAQRLQGQDKLNGTVNGKPPAQDVFVERDPGAALKFFDSARAGLDGVSGGIGGFRQEWQHERSAISASREITALFGGLNSLEQNVAIERRELDRVSQLAQEQHRGALAKRKEADLAFAEANRALTARQFDSAKIQLDDARDLYLDSLLLEENAGVRKRYTVEIPALIDRINQAIVQQYIAEVDAQVANGRKLFSNGEFLKAFIILETAQARWRATLGDRPNTDLDNLMDKVRNALRVSGGRDLAPEDARAPAVNGFINLANAKVAQAEKLPRTDPNRMKLLDNAYNNVRSALAMAPVYRTAKTLEFRIRKLEAPNDSTFRAEAGREIAEILSEYRNRKEQPERLYFAMKDYQDILPDYPGLKEAIQSLEVELGFRIRPPSAADVARSNDSYARAASLYDPANALTYDPSLRLLDDSISLNPGNARAIALRRAILLKQGSPEASAISQADLARFAEGKRLYNTEDYAGAYRILQDLMLGNKRNASYPPLAQLYLLTQQRLGLR